MRTFRILLVALGLLFLQGPRLFHMLLVAHATCEHGELVEVQRAPEPRIAAPERDANEDRLDAGHHEGAEHDHCDALAIRHLPSSIGPALGSASLLTIAPLARLEGRDEQRPVPLLSLAPKSSPPAV